jgi:hypothetical protein
MHVGHKLTGIYYEIKILNGKRKTIVILFVACFWNGFSMFMYSFLMSDVCLPSTVYHSMYMYPSMSLLHNFGGGLSFLKEHHHEHFSIEIQYLGNMKKSVITKQFVTSLARKGRRALTIAIDVFSLTHKAKKYTGYCVL